MKRRACLTSLLCAWPALGLLPPARAGLPDTIVRYKASVLAVGTYRATDSPRFQLRGSGFLVEDGSLLITNAHVLPEGGNAVDLSALVAQVRTGTDAWEPRALTLVGIDATHDLALLRMSGPPGLPMPMGDSNRVREGDNLAFMGFPIGGLLGYSTVTHRATVSSVAGTLPSANGVERPRARAARAAAFDVFQLDATAYPGNSGGPLFDPDSGHVLGVMNMVLIKGPRESALSHPSGISYAIPGRFVQELLARHR
ncbi:serine protease [Hydrogenophaga sp.]|uniref:S1C family serine protease n=1 Tax=Hydrogenophaga sp. TaxID=1904254 RepID=UPI0026107B46|nr:serine protease [Hydrogenophaga sp.]MCW5652290.1 trypsin-like peptidase domain-containing protein [Hydrogenophaga sp.]